MSVFALERLLEGPSSWRALTEDLARRWPAAPVGEIIMALIIAARTIDAHFLEGGSAHEGAVHGYQLAALIGLDLYALQVVGVTAPLGRDLSDWWAVEGMPPGVA
jgi:hypothetical protein